jgi:antitoxin VapB
MMAFETINVKNKKGFQAIRIPDTHKINDDKVYLKKIGNSLYIIPFHDPWDNLINSIDEFTPDYMSDREQPVHQYRESFD